LQFRGPIFNYVAKDSELREHELNVDEWRALELVTAWLKFFRSATTQMSVTKQSMLSTTHTIFRGLQQQLKSIISGLPASADPDLKQGLIDAHLKLSDYFTKFDDSRYYTWVARSFILFRILACVDNNLVLDPRVSYESLREDYAKDDDLISNLEASKSDLQSHYAIHYAPTSAPLPLMSTPHPATGSPQRVDVTSHYRKHVDEATSNELAEYFRITSIPEPFDGVDPLQWWFSWRHQFPHLYRLVCNILCITGESLCSP
jgi:hypothetical protein